MFSEGSEGDIQIKPIFKYFACGIPGNNFNFDFHMKLIHWNQI